MPFSRFLSRRPPLAKLRRALEHRRSALIIFAAVTACQVVGGFEFVERELTVLRFAATPRTASRDIVLVEIDSRSLTSLGVWPWPRTHHAEVVRRLVAASAQRIAFDVDFSATSTAAADARFEQALARSGGRVILPVFRRPDQGADAGGLASPLPRFADHVQLAHINVAPDADGRVRRITPVARGADSLPSLALLLAEPPPASTREGYIDFGIRPNTVPRLSFVDVLHGEFDPAQVAGRRVLIGATALELGDRHAVPRWQIMPGAMVQILAAETLGRGGMLKRAGPATTLILSLLMALTIGAHFAGSRWRLNLALAGGAAAGALGASFVSQALAGIIVDSAAVCVALVLTFGIGLTARIDQQAKRIVLESAAALHCRALFHRVVDSSADAIFILTPEGRIESCNPAAELIFGRSSGWMRGQSLADLLALDVDGESARFARLLRLKNPAAVAGEPWELVGRRRGGETVPIEVSVSTVARQRRAGSSPVLVCTCRDVSERRRAEEARRVAMETALAAERAKSNFLANASHEWRTPLNHIIGFTELLQSGMCGTLTDKQREYAGHIEGSGRHLLTMIQDVLDLSAIEGEFDDDGDIIDLAGLVEACAGALHTKAATKALVD